MDIDKLQPGGGLDILVAERVMGWKNCGIDPSVPGGIHAWKGIPPGKTDYVLLPSYSTDLGTAMLVASELHSQGFEYEIFVGHVSPGAFCRFRKRVDEDFKHYQRETPLNGSCLTMAICLAGLKAVLGLK